MLQVLDRLCRRGDKGLYISGEESETQIKLRSDRLGLTSPGLLVATETCLENIIKVVEETRPAFLALDSIQTLYTATLPAAPGSLTQVRETAFRLVQQAKLTGIATFLIGHVTKEGAIRRPHGTGASRGYGALPGRRPEPRLPAAPHRQEPLRPHP